MHTSIVRWRFLHHVGLVVASCLVVASLSARAAEDTVEIGGEVVAVADGRVRVDLGAVPPDAQPARGDSVSFHKTLDGFELEAGTGVVDEVGAGFVWVAEVDSRVAPGMEARIEASKGSAAGTGSSAAASDDGELERVMRRHWEAMGGDAWADVESLRVSGQWFAEFTNQYRFTWKRPDRFSIESTSDPHDPIESRADAEMIDAQADGQGWRTRPPADRQRQGGDRRSGTSPEERAIVRYTVPDSVSIDPYFRLEEPLSHWRSMGLEITFEGREEMRGEPVYHVRVRRNDTELSYFLHAETYRLAHTVIRAPDEGYWWGLRSYDDYQPADGLMIARSITKSIQLKPGQPPEEHEWTIRRVEVNPDVDDSFFREP